MEKSILFLMNDKYKILNIISEKQAYYREDYYASISQEEIATIAGLSKGTVNKILKDLIGAGFVDSYFNSKGKYVLTLKGRSAIELVNSFSEK